MESESPRAFPRTPPALPVALLGGNLWAVAVAVPTALVSAEAALSTSVLAPLAPLALGIGSFASRPNLARASLFVLFPAALGFGLESGGAPGGWAGGASALLSAVSLIAYLAAAAWTLERTAPAIAATSAPFATNHPIQRPLSFRARRVAAFVLCLGGSLAIAILAPSWDSPSARAAAFGPAAGAASALTAVLGGVLGVLVLGAYLAPSTRAERRTSARRSLLRALVYAAVAMAGGALILTGRF